MKDREERVGDTMDRQLDIQAPNVQAGVKPEGAPLCGSAGSGKVQLAVFDFDGTCIEGNSPVLLVKHLALSHMLAKRVTARIALWGVRYKLRLPQDESWVRGMVFSAFEGKPVGKADAFLAKFYDDVVAPRWRGAAIREMQRNVDEGRTVIVVSASFEPIILRAMQDKPFQYQISTKMKANPDGTYTREVDGLPVEGDEKLAAVTRFADAKYGEGNWELAHAYGDHHSDRTILRAARVPHAVDPDRPLLRTARREGWDVLDW